MAETTQTIQNKPAYEEDVISLSMLLGALKKGIWLIALLAILFSGVAVYYVTTTAPTYESQLKVLISPIQTSSNVESLLNMASTSDKITTEVALITCDTNMMNAFSLLDLTKYYDENGVCFAEKAFSPKGLKNMISVNQQTNTREVIITVRSKNPQFAADYANALGVAFRDLLSSIARESKTSQRETIENQIPVNEANLTDARDRLALFMNQNETSQMAVKEAVITKQIANIQLQKQPLSLQLSEAQTLLDTYGAILKAANIAVITPEDMKKNADVADMLKDYKANLTESILYQNVQADTNASRTYILTSSIDGKKKELLNKITAAFPAAETILRQRDIANYASALTDYLAVSAQLDVLSDIEGEYNSQLAVYLDIERQLQELKSDVAIYESLVLSLKQMLEETRVMESSVTGNVTVVDPAVEPTQPIKPEKTKTVAIAFLGGCFIGYAITFLFMLMDTTIKTEDDVKSVIGNSLTSLGWIPYKTHLDKKSPTPQLFVVNSNSSYVAERYRILSNNITYSSTKELKVLVFTSSDMSEGKTVTTINTAATYAMLGKKVLVIDGDFRYSVLEKNFNLKHTNKGIADVLIKHTPVKDCIIRPIESVKNLHFLPQGYSSANPNVIYGSQEFKDMMEELKGIYDYIFVDCPPMSFGSDFSLLSKMIDGYIYNVRAGVTSKEMLAEAIKATAFTPAPCLGYVLYGVIATNNSSYYGGYSYKYNSYSYGYGYNGKKEKKERTRKSYRKIHKVELKNRAKGRRYGAADPVLAFKNGEEGFTTVESTSFFNGLDKNLKASKPVANEQKKVEEAPKKPESILGDVTDDMLASIESDSSAKGGTNK
ncbi:MAG: polysaccharide biosynthesis tyrosine autokinase [Spirochaetales bacterium]|nr:polysaccharide biosynthesis tyrosine autokinase [Candidatus Physcosoma equi]